MAKHANEDLFEGTTMTFGEHLEELRVCLTKALVALVIGTLIGLVFAKQVVKFIESPIKKALSEHYSQMAAEDLVASYGDEVSSDLQSFVKDEQMIYEEVYLEAAELQRINGLADAAAETADAPMSLDEVIEQELPAPLPSLVKTRLWRPAKARLTILSVHEGFMIWLKAGFVAGLLMASPIVFRELWIFVAAGLYPHERRYVHIYLPFSLGLFLLGAATAFFLVFGPVLAFLFSFARMLSIDLDLRISEVISFVLFLPLGFGIAFQLPLVMLFLHRIGVFTVEMYLEKWRIAILVIFVISMMLTPADPYSMLLMASPLTALYFLGIALCHWMPRGKNPFTEVYEP